MTTAYPLSWPDNIPRSARRDKSQFRTTLAGALKNVQDSLRKFGEDSRKPVKNVVLSSNCSLGAEKPADPGVAVWFVWEEQQLCIPVDRYPTPAENLQAIHHIIEARRTELRHGTLALVRATFQGFRALPPPPGKRSWREVLGVPPDEKDLRAVRDCYRRVSMTAHPDRGGSAERMAEVNIAFESAEKELAP